MYTDANYLWGLVSYYLGAGLVLLFCWHFRQWIGWRYFRNLILVLLSVVLLMPFSAYPDMNYLAPAWFVSIFEGLTEATEAGYLRAGVPLIVATLVAVVVYIMVEIGLLYRRRKSAGEPSGSKSPEARDEEPQGNIRPDTSV